MRPLASAVALTLLASTATAAPQRSSNLGVRVTVVRSCAIKTDASASGASVTCSAGQNAPVITTTVVPAAPAPQAETSALTTPSSAASATVGTPSARSAAVTSVALDGRPAETDDAADDTDEPADTPDTTVRVVTINF